jgi:phage gpG-like protein
MRYEVRQHDGKWIVWETVNQCGAVAGRLRPTAADGSPRVVVLDGRPFMFWTQDQAQEWADTLNDPDQSGFV